MLCQALQFGKPLYVMVLQENVWDTLGVCVRCISLQMYFYINRWKISFMHLQIYLVVILPSQTAVASLQFGKHHSEITRMLQQY